MIMIMSELLITRLTALAEDERHYDAGDNVFHRGSPVVSLFVLTGGIIHLVRDQPQGFPLILQRSKTGDILAEASIFTERYHCDAIAIEASSVRVISRAKLEQLFSTDPDLSYAWAEYLAITVQRARAQVEILSLKTVAERVDAWCVLNGNKLPDKGQWSNLAAEIGVTPEALYRDLAKRRHS